MPAPSAADDFLLHFELLDMVGKTDKASMTGMTDWAESQISDFCRLTHPQVTAMQLSIIALQVASGFGRG